MAYNWKIVIQQNTVTRDDYGGDNYSWSTYKTVWSEMEDTGGTLIYESDQPVWRDSKTFKIRTADAPDVKAFPNMRISYDGDYYSIVGIEKDGRLFTTLTGEAYDDE